MKLSARALANKPKDRWNGPAFIAEYQSGYRNGLRHGEPHSYISDLLWSENERKSRKFTSSGYWNGYRDAMDAKKEITT